MKISCLPVSLFGDITGGKMSIGEWAAFARELGLNGIDLSVLLIKNRTPVCVASAARQIEDAGMRVVMVTTYPDFTNPDALQREREFAHAQSDIALASSLGAEYIRLTAGQIYDWPDERAALSVAAEYLVRAKEFADKMGVKVLFENHSKPGAWEKPDCLFETRRFLMLADMLKDSGIGINFDTANTFAFGDDPVPVLKKVLPMVKTIHINDCDKRGSLNFVVAGTGSAPIPELLKAAKDGGFDGWICIEEAGFKGTEGVREAVAFVKDAIAAL